jgi:hypothetical protein
VKERTPARLAKRLKSPALPKMAAESTGPSPGVERTIPLGVGLVIERGDPFVGGGDLIVELAKHADF